MMAAVLVLVTAASTLLGVAALLLDVTQDRAFSSEVRRADSRDVDVTAFLVDLAATDLDAVREQARDVVGRVLAPMRPTITSSASSQVRRFAAADGVGYLGTSDALDRRADLVSGRWPGGSSGGRSLEAVLPEAAAARLDLAVGDRVLLGDEVGLDGVDGSLSLVLVGTFRPRPDSGWDGDRLAGAGFDPAFSDGTVTAPAYGPFMVGDADFVATGSSVSSLRVTGHPTLGLADEAALRSAVGALDDATGLMQAAAEDRVRITRVASDLPRTEARLQAEQAAARSTVLVVLLLGAMLSITCLLLAGRLVAAVRDDDRALLVSLGLDRRQQLGAAVAEAVLVAVSAAVLAVPAASLVHSRLTQLSSLREAGLGQGPSITPGLVATVLGGALVMATALVLPALDTTTAGSPSRWRGTARSGLDVLLAVAVAAAWWQLRSRPSGAAADGDLVLTVAPVVVLLGLVLLLIRGVPRLLRVVASACSRSRSLVLPLAVTQAARRPRAGAAMVLIASAVAAAVFGVAFHATWERSQRDQADLRVGTDLTLALPIPATADDAAAVLRAAADTGGPVVSAVAQRPVTLGRYVDAGSPPVLVAVDARRAGPLLRGRLDDGRTWAEVGDELVPDDEVDGLGLPVAGAGVELEATAPADVTISVTPTAVVQDSAGFRTAVAAEPLPVDGRRHAVRWQRELHGQLVAVRLELSADATPREEGAPSGEVAVSVFVPGDAAGDGAEWEARALGSQTPVTASSVAVEASTSGTVLRTTADVDLLYLAYTGADLLATSFAEPEAMPVAVSQRLVDTLGAEVGTEISAVVGGAAVPVRVAAIVPDVPSAPGRVAVLADLDTLSRALIHSGRLDPVVDGWWVANPSPSTERALRDLDLGEVTTREGVSTELARGPMRVTVPASLLALVVAAVVLLVVGAGLVVGVDRRRRTLEVERLRALGLTGRETRRLLLLEHGVFLAPLVLVGALVGAATTWALGPYLVRSDVGSAPVPGVVVVMPWFVDVLLVGGLVALVLVAGAAVVSRATLGRRPARDERLVRTSPRLHRPTVLGRLRQDSGLLLLIGLVVALTTALTTAVGPVTDRTADRAIGASVREAGPRGAVVATAPVEDEDPRGRTRNPVAAVELRQDAEYARFTMPGELAAVVRPGVASVTTTRLQLQDAGPGRYLRLAYLDPHDGPPQVTYVAGGPPRASVGEDQARVELPADAEPWPVQVAVSEQTAAALGLEPGDRLPAKDEQARSVDIRVSGVFVATAPDDEAWAGVPQLLHPVVGNAQGVPTASGAALVSAESLPDLRLAVPLDDLTQRVVFNPRPSELTWRGSAGLVRAIGALRTSPGLARGGISWDSLLDGVLDDARAQVATARGQAELLLVGLFTASILVLLLAAQLLVRRRSGSVTLARERGASLAGIAGELLVEAVVVAAGGAAVGLVVARLVAGGVSWAWLVPVLAVACLGSPVLGVVAARRTDSRRAPANRRARRLIARAWQGQRYAVELAVLAVAVLSFTALRQRAGQVSGDGGDLTAAGAPTWWAVVGALVVVRALPVVARLLLRRSRGSAGGGRFFAVASLARSGAPVLPMLVITVAVLHATFGLALAATEHEGQSAGALLAVGGDARLSAAPDRELDGIAAEVARAVGVEAAVAARVEDGVRASSRRSASAVRLVVVDADAYEGLLASSALPDAPGLSRLTRPVGDGVPALLLGGDAGLRDRLVVRWDDVTVPLAVVGTAPRVDASVDPVLVVDAASFAATGAVAEPNTVWAVGADAPSVLGSAAGSEGSLDLYTDELASRRDAPLASGLEVLALGGAVLLLLLAIAAVVLSAAAEVPARAEALGRLRSLGLTRAELHRTLVLQLMTPVAFAVAAGLVLGALAAATMFGSLGLEHVTGQTTTPSLVLSWWALLVGPALVAAVLVVAQRESTRLRRTSLAALLRVEGGAGWSGRPRRAARRPGSRPVA